jgi:hypothetical protein
MDLLSPAEELPALYRALLDRVAQIEAEGRRTAAYRLRRDATRIYSHSWDDRARRALQHLLDHTSVARTGLPKPGREAQRSSVAA